MTEEPRGRSEQTPFGAAGDDGEAVVASPQGEHVLAEARRLLAPSVEMRRRLLVRVLSAAEERTQSTFEPGGEGQSGVA